jgi:uncharacterized protein
MARAKSDIVVKIAGAMAEIDAAQWDACANPDPALYDPFISHAFLKALEDARCAAPNKGWRPQHLLIEDENGVLQACAPAYLKSHSRGEYVFDAGWAEAYERAGGDYYPKLQVAVPFTPVPGRRLLVRPDPQWENREKQLTAALVELTKRQGASSFHVTFLTQGEWERAGAIGCLRRTGQQFHWHNRGYADFDAFLETFASRKRKGVRKERRDAVSAGIEIEHVTGGAITETQWDAFYKFYVDTGNRKWGTPYLNREFFSRLGQTMSERCLLVLCKRDGKYIAGALNLIGGDCLYGRYWGAIEHHPCLHFEVCYYQAIEYAITHKLARVEAGAQGEHKLARGYLPVTTYSAHWMADARLSTAIADYLQRERGYIAQANEELAAAGPYRKRDENNTNSAQPQPFDDEQD